MRPSRLLLALAGLLGAASCQPAEHAVLIEVHTQADLESLRVVVLSLDAPRPTSEQVRRIARSAADINADPLRVAVELLGPADVLVHLVGTTPSGERLIATRCYPVDGVLRDSVMLFGPFDTLDLDGDGWVSDPAAVCREPGPDGQTAVSCDGDLYLCPANRAADCDDSSAEIYPGAGFICLDGIDQDCDGEDEPCGDQDGDGWDACPAMMTGLCDCNDNVPTINPDAEDICLDGIDQDCFEGDACCDADGDGSPRCGPSGPDCDDGDPNIHPAATEVCDGIDNNCNGQTDELDECRGPDLDGDGVAACGREEPGEPCDCNDCDRGIHQGARELCGPRVDPSVPGNGIDEDCDGMIDEGCPAGDLDGDGVEPPRDCDDADALAFPPSGGREPIDYCEDGRANNCIPGEDASCADDTDGDRWVEPPECEASADINPAATETCNGVDDDCDGVRDEVLSVDNSVGCVNAVPIIYATDFQHCGGCRVLCDLVTADRCRDGVCDCSTDEPRNGACDSGTDPRCCADGCVDADSDRNNCGTCGHRCEQGEICVGGQCACGGSRGAADQPACPEAAGHTGAESNVCCGDPASDGRCTIVRGSDVANCGDCGAVCTRANASPACVDGQCRIGTCAAGYDNCDGVDSNGCEPLTTNTNCGACGVPCARANATATCASGTCQIAMCNSGWGNCDGVDSNGCETRLDTTTNCGTCGTTCTRANATATCSTGVCAISSCSPGFANCDSVDSNGCETSLDANATCGSCTNNCGTNATCMSRACACNAGRLDCTAGSPWCETAFSTSNCGMCGRSCGATETCDSMGRCVCGSTPGAPGGGSPCTSGQACCSGSCAALNTISNCRSCGNSCDSDESCGSGGCTCSGTTRASGPACPSPAVCCADGCATLGSDPMHCGSCTTQCVAGETCSSGNCRCNGGSACSSGQTCCAAPTGCVNLSSDPNSCGSCGRQCRPGETCVGGSCRCNGGAGCGMDETCCGTDGCVPLSASCGSVCNVCGGGTTCCGGSCVDTSSSTSHCGACGGACASGAGCFSGTCRCNAGGDACSALQGNSCSGTNCRCNGAAACNGTTQVCMGTMGCQPP